MYCRPPIFHSLQIAASAVLNLWCDVNHTKYLLYSEVPFVCLWQADLEKYCSGRKPPRKPHAFHRLDWVHRRTTHHRVLSSPWKHTQKILKMSLKHRGNFRINVISDLVENVLVFMYRQNCRDSRSDESDCLRWWVLTIQLHHLSCKAWMVCPLMSSCPCMHVCASIQAHCFTQSLVIIKFATVVRLYPVDDPSQSSMDGDRYR